MIDNDLEAPVRLFYGKKSVPYREALRRVDIPPSSVLSRRGTWVVTTYGVECLSHYYPIEKGCLRNDGSRSWPEHMAEKRWVVQADFLAAYEDAMQRFADA